MGDFAVNTKNDPLAIDGLEDIFDQAPVTEIEVTDAEQVTSADEPITGAVELVPTGAEGVPVEVAAQLLGTTVNALKKRLRKGTLRGTKLDVKHGEKWFVDSAELDNYVAPVTEYKLKSTEQVTDTDAPVTGAIEPMPTSAAVDLLNRIEELETKLEGATYRNGYLAAENEGLRALLGSKDSQIKLLTDSHYNKPKGWSKFWSWFVGS